MDLVRDDGGLDHIGGDAEEGCRWTDESAETGKAATKTSTTKRNRTGA